MATLAGNSIASSYTSLLKLNGNTDSTAAGNGSNAIQVKTGDDDATPLFLNTDRLGIGTANVQSPLHIFSTINNTFSDTISATDFTGDVLTIENKPASSNDDYVSIAMSTSGSQFVSSRIVLDNDGSGAGALNFQLRSPGDLSNTTTFMKIKSTGDVEIPSGSVGIGTSSPSSFDSEANDLVVGDGSGDSGITIYNGQNAGDFGSIFFADGTSGTALKAGFIRYEQNTSAMTFGMNAVEKVKIDINGNVGIGISDPDAYLAGANNLVLGGTSGNHGLTIRSASDSAGMIAFGDGDASTDAGYRGQIKYLHSSDKMLFITSSQNRIAIDSNGTGIGTTSPDALLDLTSSTGYANLRLGQNKTNESAQRAGISAQPYLKAEEPTAGMFMFIDGTGSTQDTADLQLGGGHGNFNAVKQIKFYTASDAVTTSGTEVMRLDANSRISLSNNDNNSNNTVFGNSAFNAGSDNGSDNNTAIGHLSMGTGTVSGALNNTAVGYLSLEDLTSGDQNTGLGVNSLKAITSGSGNVGIGFDSGQATIDSNYGVYIGWGAGASGDIVNDGTIAIGYKSLYALTSGASNVAVGYESAKNLTTGASNVSIGYQAMANSHLGCDKNVIIGRGAFYNGEVDEAVFIGFNAGGDGTTTTGANGTVGIGKSSLNALTSGGKNVAVGFESAKAVTTGQRNTVLGHQAFNVTVDADECVAIGNYSMGGGVATADGTVAIGRGSLALLTSGVSNVAVGYQTGDGLTDGGNNVLIGYNANSAGGASASQNVGIGVNALLNATGSNNTAVGYNAGDVTEAATLSTFIGYSADGSGANINNETVIGANATGQGGNSVTLGNADVTDVYMAQDSAATCRAGVFRTGPQANLGVGQTPVDENSGEYGTGYVNLFRDDTATVKQILFGKNGSEVGSISTDGTNTAFNTSSDYRLKENEVEIPDGLERLNKLKPYRFNWKSENDEDGKPTRTVDGLFAHEVAEIIPEAVIGQKDAVDSNGKMKIQSMDYSKVVPLLIKAVQELSAKVTELENK